ncbi:MAG: hypothetical protein U0797_16080 [Gemmataceae bacterium]
MRFPSSRRLQLAPVVKWYPRREPPPGNLPYSPLRMAVLSLLCGQPGGEE